MVQRTGLGWAKVSEAQAGKLHTLLSSLVNSSGAQEREAARRECGPGAQPAQHIPWGTQCLETALTEPGVLHCLCCPVLSCAGPVPVPLALSIPKIPEHCTSQNSPEAHTTGLLFLKPFCFHPKEPHVSPILSSHISSPLHTKCGSPLS